MKDYYRILELTPDATEEQIRKAYRRLALLHHPDKNHGDPKAEERFKEIAEAYGVLIDRTKRTQYDRYRTTGAQQKNTDEGFNYSQEDILKDLFNNPRFRHGFEELFKEFEKTGMRFDQNFLNQVFFGGRGILFGGIFVWSPFGKSNTRIKHSRQQSDSIDNAPPIEPQSAVKLIGKKIGKFIFGEPKVITSQNGMPSSAPNDLIYNMTISQQDALQGKWIQISIDAGKGKETLKVKIPPQSINKSRLRLKNKGKHSDSGRGDLFILITIAEDEQLQS